MVRVDAMSDEQDEDLKLSPEDIKLYKAAAPIVRYIIGFGKVSKFIIVTIIGLAAGAAMLGDSAIKIVRWFLPPHS
jgi:hypothetical protein